jgi:hypothetical protein
MTQDSNREDEQWLNALAGRSDPTADAKLIQQAEALRRALKARSELLASQVPEADEAQYQQLLFRLRKEGLNSSNHGWKNPKIWGVAASIFLCVGVGIQMGIFTSDGLEENQLRGGEHATVMIVTDPELRLIELQAGFELAGEAPTVVRHANEEILVTVKATEKVLAYLDTQRIEPEVLGGNLVLKLRPAKPKK